MKMNIQITKMGKGIFGTEEKIVDIDICNGNWRYWDNLQETDEKIPLTINSVRKSRYLDLPVKDAYPIHNREKALNRENPVFEVEDAFVRTYDDLLGFLICRIENCKEDFKKFDWWTERTFTAVLFQNEYISAKEDDIVGEIVYKEDGMITVTITRVDD